MKLHAIIITILFLPNYLIGQVDNSKMYIKAQATYMGSPSFTIDIFHSRDSILLYYKFHDSTSKKIKTDTSYSNCLEKLSSELQKGHIDSAFKINDSCDCIGSKYYYYSYDTIKIAAKKTADFSDLLLSFCDSLTYNSRPVLDGFKFEIITICNNIKKHIHTYSPEIKRNYLIYSLLKQTFEVYRQVTKKNKNTLGY